MEPDDGYSDGQADLGVEVETFTSDGSTVVTVDVDGNDIADVVLIVDQDGNTHAFTPAEDTPPAADELVDAPPSPAEPALVEAPPVDDAPVVADPEVEPGEQSLVVPVDGEYVSAGPATVDVTGDGVPDAAIVDEGDAKVYVVDLDGDLIADRLVRVVDGEVDAGLTRDPGTNQWYPTPSADSGSPTEPVTEPAPETSPGPATGELVMETPDGAFSLGPPTEDADGNGQLDTAIVKDGTLTIVGSDLDGDGKVDRVATFEGDSTEPQTRGWIDPETGEWVFDRIDGQPVDVPSTDAADPGTPSGGEPIEIPAQYQVTVDPNAELMVQTAQRQMATVAEAAAQLWAWAYPGDAWPTDDSGNPYPPQVLLGVIANDNELPEAMAQVQATARNVLESDQRQTSLWTS